MFLTNIGHFFLFAKFLKIFIKLQTFYNILYNQIYMSCICDHKRIIFVITKKTSGAPYDHP
jgi:hypothetical protein